MGSAAEQWSPSESVTVDRSSEKSSDEKSLLDRRLIMRAAGPLYWVEHRSLAANEIPEDVPGR